MRAIRRALRASIFDRRAHTELFFDSDATADAVLLVSGVIAVVYIGQSIASGVVGFSLQGLLSAVIFGLMNWLIIAVATWFMATRLFGGGGHMQTMMRLQGHCELPLLLALVPLFGAEVGIIWSTAAKVVATSEASSVDLLKATASVLVGLAVVFLLRALLRLPFALLGAF